MHKLKTRAGIGIAALLALAAATLVPAAPASAATPPQGLATVVACPSGLVAHCVEYRYGFSVPNSTGQLGIYYTVRESSGGNSYVVERVKLVNNTSRTVFFGGLGANYLGYGSLVQGSNQNSFSVLSGSTLTFNQAGFNGVDKGVWYTKGYGTYGVSYEFDYTWQYHNASYVPLTGGGAFLLA